MSLNPYTLGWTEFLLRLGLSGAALVAVLLAAAVVVRITLDIGAGVGWIVRKARGRGFE